MSHHVASLRTAFLRPAVLITLLMPVMAVSFWSLADEPKPEEEWKAPARAARKKNPVPIDEKSVAAGKAVYARECLSCHGESGKGDGPLAKDLNPKPRDLRTAKMWEQTDGSLFWKLTEGRKPMPTYDKLLTEDERWQVINYTRSTYAPKGAGDGQPK